MFESDIHTVKISNTVDWSDEWMSIFLEEAALNAVKSFTEKDELNQDNNDPRLLKFSYSILTPQQLKSRLLAAEQARFEVNSLTSSKNILALSLTDNGIGVHPIIEDSGLEIGRSIHFGTTVSGTGQEILFGELRFSNKNTVE